MRSSKKPNKEEEIDCLLNRGVEEIIDSAHLSLALRSGRKLRVKLGIDPTKPDLHLGHAVILRKLREFQNLGHQIVLIIGDFTARIGDPSGRSEARKPLTAKEASRNARDYLRQAAKVIDVKKADVYKNSRWHGREGLASFLKLISSVTVQQILERADFKKRLAENSPITLLESVYPLLQGYDSVKVRADVEIGGTDQTFNLLMGRQVQRSFDLPEQDIMTLPLLEGTDGARKMSKSYGNYIGLAESPREMFGKVMSLPDGLILKYFVLCTDISDEEIAEIDRKMAKAELNPRDAKARLAFEIVKIYHGEKAAEQAEEEFNEIFREKKIPGEMFESVSASAEIGLVEALILTKLATSRSEARRFIEQGGVKVDQEKIVDLDRRIDLKAGPAVLQVGSRRFARIVHNK
jgi:tyrosyl-tRNA synthetase